MSARDALDGLLGELGVELPVLAAPMSGGPGTPELAIAAGRARSLGFLAAGYKQPDALAAEIAAVRAAGVPFGVNLFAPNPLPVDADEFRRYAGELAGEAEALGVQLDGAGPREDDDWWEEKIELLLAEPPPLVSFTFGIPPARGSRRAARRRLPARAGRHLARRGCRRGRRGPRRAGRPVDRGGRPLGHAHASEAAGRGAAARADRRRRGAEPAAADRRRRDRDAGGGLGRAARRSARRDGRDRAAAGGGGGDGGRPPRGAGRSGSQRDGGDARVHRTARPRPAKRLHRSPRGARAARLPGDPPPDRADPPRRGVRLENRSGCTCGPARASARLARSPPARSCGGSPKRKPARRSRRRPRRSRRGRWRPR